MYKLTELLCLVLLYWILLPLRRYENYRNNSYWRNPVVQIGIIAIAIVAILVPASVEAQTENAVTVAEWREVLANVATDDDDALLNVWIEVMNASNDLIDAGNFSAALHKSTMGLVLSRHIIDRKEREGHRNDRDHILSTNNMQSALLKAGISLASMKKSAVNLGIAINETPTTMMIKASPKVRPATPAERAAMISVVRNNLIDPTSPIFGRADVVGNQACLTVNSKNRFGGYTGNKEAVLSYNSKKRTWNGGAIIGLPHGVCLDLRN